MMIIIILFWGWKYRALVIYSFGTSEIGKPKLKEYNSSQIKYYFIVSSRREG